MRLLVLSDLHFEFHDDGGRAFVESMPNAMAHRIDAIAIAGDLAPVKSGHLATALGVFCDRYPIVVFVAGNHELYKSSPEVLVEARDRIGAQDRFSNLHWLERDSVVVAGVRILGTSLWYGRGGARLAPYWSDFRCIDGLDPWAYDEHARSIAFLRRELRSEDVLVTHFLPTPRSVSEKYADAPSNVFFVSDIEDLLVERSPRLVVHGHTHTACDYILPNDITRVVCNPYGYHDVEQEENAAFDRSFIIDIEVGGSS